MTESTYDDCSIERCTADSDFSLIPNEISQHPTMSSDATTVLLYLLSCKRDWIIKPKNVWNAKNISRDHVYAAFNELIDLGYMKREEVRIGNLKRYVKYKVSYLKKYLRRPESRDTEPRDTESQDGLIRTIRKKNDQEKESVVTDPVGPPPSKVFSEHVDSRKGLDQSKFYEKIVTKRVSWTSNEISYAWETLHTYNGVIHDWWRFIEGTVDKYRIMMKSKNASAAMNSQGEHNPKNTGKGKCKQKIQQSYMNCKDSSSTSDTSEQPSLKLVSLAKMLDDSGIGWRVAPTS